jgi:hypothetical protein
LQQSPKQSRDNAPFWKKVEVYSHSDSRWIGLSVSIVAACL